MSKFRSRKFWMAVAAFLASVGTTIAGLQTDSKSIVIAGIVCTMLSSGIYAAAEAYADGNRPVQDNRPIDIEKDII